MGEIIYILHHQIQIRKIYPFDHFLTFNMKKDKKKKFTITTY